MTKLWGENCSNSCPTALSVYGARTNLPERNLM